MKSIFDYKDYRAYLNDWILQKPGKGRGIRSEIAKAARCQISYISRILDAEAELSLEQADLLSSYLGHSPEEAGFFLLLILSNRAGTNKLKKHFEKQINEVLKKRLVLKERLRIKETLSREDQATYYSAWYYAAIHILISIDQFQSKEALSKVTGIPIAQISEVLDFLVSVGLARQTKGQKFELGKARLHLERESPMISKHHTNWRIQAIRSLERSPYDDLHYSVVVGISEEDIAKIQAMAVEFIKRTMAIVHDSKQQGAHCLTLDFFRI